MLMCVFIFSDIYLTIRQGGSITKTFSEWPPNHFLYLLKHILVIIQIKILVAYMIQNGSLLLGEKTM